MTHETIYVMLADIYLMGALCMCLGCARVSWNVYVGQKKMTETKKEKEEGPKDVQKNQLKLVVEGVKT